MLERVAAELRAGPAPASAAGQPPFEEALAYPGVARLLRQGGRPASALVVPIEVPAQDGRTVRFLTTIATLGTAQDLTLRELRVETYHPADCG